MLLRSLLYKHYQHEFEVGHRLQTEKYAQNESQVKLSPKISHYPLSHSLSLSLSHTHTHTHTHTLAPGNNPLSLSLLQLKFFFWSQNDPSSSHPNIVRTGSVQAFFWRSKDELISDVLLWPPTYGCAKAGRPARTYIQQLCEDTGCNPEDLPEAMNDREKWRERVREIRAGGATWWWWWIPMCAPNDHCFSVILLTKQATLKIELRQLALK